MRGIDIEKLLLEGLEWEIEREIDKTANDQPTLRELLLGKRPAV